MPDGSFSFHPQTHPFPRARTARSDAIKRPTLRPACYQFIIRRERQKFSNLR